MSVALEERIAKRRAARKAAWQAAFDADVAAVLARIDSGERVELKADKADGLKAYERTIRLIKAVRLAVKDNPAVFRLQPKPPARHEMLTAWKRR